jgi:radical SAM superfamily enzyme YgiQ (UPF0313 family)
MKAGLFQAHYPELNVGWNSALAPLGLGYLAAYAHKYVPGVEVAIERDLEALIAAKPDLVGITVTTANASIAVRQARRIKDELGCPVICGGPHPTTLPGVLDPAFDLAVLHEGEATFAELLELYKAEGRFTPQSLAKVAGILYREQGGALATTARRAKITNLDRIPYPDRDQLFRHWQYPGPEIQMMTARGCPYGCSFCSTVKIWGQQYYCNSDEYVLGEIEQIRRRYNPTVLHLYDDLFIVRKARVLRLLKAMRERGLHEGIRLSCFVRSNLLDDEIMDAFARTNFSMLNIGFESGSDQVLKTLNKQAANVERNHRAIELGRNHGVEYSSCFILGVPGETRADIVATFDFVRASVDVFSYVEFAPLQVLPGTNIWQTALQHGVSEHNLTGVALEPEDLNNEAYFYRQRWPYLNEANIPREELLSYYFIGQNVARMVYEFTMLRRRQRDLGSKLYSPRFVAENVSFADIMRAKVQRKLGRFMPMGEPPKQPVNS